MWSSRKSVRRDEAGQEPTVLKILVGIVLVAIGLGVGITLYRRFGGAAETYLDYSVNVSPSSGTISSSGSTTASIDVETSVDFSETVTLNYTGQPSNVSVSFSPASGEPTFGSTMTINAEGAPLGTHTITIRAEAGDTEKTATYDLTIE